MIDFPEPELVTDDTRLEVLCREWQKLPYIALDTEFIRVSTFYPRAGLIQIGDGEKTYLLDPLSLKSWDSFIAILISPDIVKVMHSCSEDLVVFNHFYRCMPGPIFDTQKAAAFLGYGYSISYLNLVLQVTGDELSKGETRSDWLNRPLSDKQVKYAALDVAYLPRLYTELQNSLEKSGKLPFLVEECERMRQIGMATENAELWPDFYLTLGAAWRLDGKGLGVLKALCWWREQKARERDKPRSWVARDADLIQLAEKLPQDRQALSKLTDMSRNIYQQDANELLGIIANSAPVAAEIADNLEGAPMSPAQRNTLKRCQQAVRTVAGETGIAEELLARKKQLITLMHLNRGPAVRSQADPMGKLLWSEDLSGWQRELLAPRLEPILAGSFAGGAAGE